MVLLTRGFLRNKIPPLEGGFFVISNVIYTIIYKVLFSTKQKEGSYSETNS